MKISKTCPKCASRDILEVQNSSSYTPQIVHELFKKIKSTTYICCSCGFTENWVDQKCLLKLKKDSPISAFVQDTRKIYGTSKPKKAPAKKVKL